MNLLIDPWVPVLDTCGHRWITLREVLCTDEEWNLALPRDDMELAALQLLVSLTQVLFPPADQAALRERLKSPLSESEYSKAIKRYLSWFDLNHSVTPFMQTRGVSAKEPTPIQKLFIGLPEGNNHAFFNAEGEIAAVCGGCAAIALFNQASNCPSFGGGFKGSLRGSAPITTLIDAPTLRRRIWENVLPATEVSRLLPEYNPQGDDRPVWVEPIEAGKTISVASLGLFRGLFWQPARVELLRGESGNCDHCGGESSCLYAGFNKEKFSYQLEGVWPHPHSPRQWEERKGERHERFASFTTAAPAWTQLTQFLIERQGRKEGHVPAPVVSSRRQRRSTERLQLLVGGYRNNQASVIERRHELFSFAPGWEEAGEQLEDAVELGISVKEALYRSLIYASGGQRDAFKGIGVQLEEEAERAFYRRSEPFMHEVLREMDYGAYERHRAKLIEKLTSLAKELYEEAVMPYRYDPELAHAIAAGRARLQKGLSKLKETLDVRVD